MEAWEIALNKFLDDWRDMDEVVGALVCGSFVTGNPTAHSDIDVVIVLREGNEWRERGNRIVDGLLIEYFANPPAQIRQYFKGDYADDRRVEAVLFTTGRVMFDRDGTVESLKSEAVEWMGREFQPLPDTWPELNRYTLWDNLDNHQDAFEQGSRDFPFVYHNTLTRIYSTYAKYLRHPVVPFAKLYKCLTEPELAERRYRMDPFPDKEFLSLFTKAVTETEPARMLEHAANLTRYVLDALGGFEIDGWAFRSPAKTE